MSLLSPRHHWHATREVIALLGKHRQLTWAMAKREIADRYAGQFLGTAWAILHPFVLLLIYVIVFAHVSNASHFSSAEE